MPSWLGRLSNIGLRQRTKPATHPVMSDHPVCSTETSHRSAIGFHQGVPGLTRSKNVTNLSSAVGGVRIVTSTQQAVDTPAVRIRCHPNRIEGSYNYSPTYTTAVDIQAAISLHAFTRHH